MRTLLQQTLRSHQGDALLVFNHESSGQPATRYHTGFTGSFSITLIPPRRRPTLITAQMYAEQARTEAKDCRIITINKQSPWLVLQETLQKLRVRRVLFDSAITPHNTASALQTNNPKLRLKPIAGLQQQLRIQKTETELQLLQRASNISHRAFKQLLPEINPGITELALAARLEFLLKAAGADSLAFPSIVASGLNSALPHAKPTSKKLRAGEIVVIDFGGTYHGYCADISRTVAVGKRIPSKLQEIYSIVAKAQQRGLAAAKAGLTGQELDGICRDYIASQGYGETFIHSTGHGLGLEVHELPSVAPSNETPLPENSVVTIEPGIYVPGLGGVRLEDSVYLTKKGCYNLNQRLPKQLIL